MRYLLMSLGLLAALAVGGVGITHAGDDGGSTCDGPPCCKRCE